VVWGRPVVLLVENDEAVYELVSEFLASLGYSVFGADEVTEALTLAEHLHPAAVIIDHDRPSLDGFFLMRLLRAQNPIHPVPIVFLTGHVEHRVEIDARAAGCDAFVRKPFHLDELATELSRALTQPIASRHVRLLQPWRR
jgi:CheY-like chemotaxis protein